MFSMLSVSIVIICKYLENVINIFLRRRVIIWLGRVCEDKEKWILIFIVKCKVVDYIVLVIFEKLFLVYIIRVFN